MLVPDLTFIATANAVRLGRGADYTRVEPLCKKYGLVLICDATEALGSKFAGRMLGTFGLAGCFSLSANKAITAGQGGMIATVSPTGVPLAQRTWLPTVTALRRHRDWIVKLPGAPGP